MCLFCETMQQSALRNVRAVSSRARLSHSCQHSTCHIVIYQSATWSFLRVTAFKLLLCTFDRRRLLYKLADFWEECHHIITTKVSSLILLFVACWLVHHFFCVSLPTEAEIVVKIWLMRLQTVEQAHTLFCAYVCTKEVLNCVQTSASANQPATDQSILLPTMSLLCLFCLFFFLF